MNSKKGLELAINQLVVIILMIAAIGVGLAMFLSMKDSLDDINHNVAEKIQRQIEYEMINTGALVAIPITLQEAKRGDTARFTIGIENKFDEELNFRVIVYRTNDENDDENSPKWVDQDMKLTLGPKERGFKNIWFRVPKTAEIKQYDFTVAVCYPDEDGTGESPCNQEDDNPDHSTYTTPYSSKQIVYVKVK